MRSRRLPRGLGTFERLALARWLVLALVAASAPSGAENAAHPPTDAQGAGGGGGGAGGEATGGDADGGAAGGGAGGAAASGGGTPSTCGNGALDEGEPCDGDDLG